LRSKDSFLSTPFFSFNLSRQNNCDQKITQKMTNPMTSKSLTAVMVFLLVGFLTITNAFTVTTTGTSSLKQINYLDQPTTSTSNVRPARYSPLFMAPRLGKGYEPKWKKKKTLAEELEESGAGSIAPVDKGIKGNINVVFKQGNETRTTLAMAGQPLRDVATQAGQFIKYGCGKGECGTCEAL